MFTGSEVLRLALELAGTVLAVWRIVSQSQATMKTELHEAISQVSQSHTESLTETRHQFSIMSENFKDVGLQINTILQGHVRELQGRVTRLESGQDDWTKELRQRTHDIGGRVDKMGYELELMKKMREGRHGS